MMSSYPTGFKHFANPSNISLELQPRQPLDTKGAESPLETSKLRVHPPQRPFARRVI
jgi:hypothetical protein